MLHEILLVPFLLFGSEKIRTKREKSRIRGFQMDNLKDLLGLKRKDRVQDALIRELYEVVKGMDERISRVSRPTGEGVE